LDLTKYLNLEGLNCSNNNLSTLNTQNNIKLKNLVCSNNMITVLNVNPSLSILDCSYNKINVLDLTKNIGLIDLNCRYNNLTNLTFNGTSLDCSNNNLKSLQGSYKNISNLFNPSLEKMICNNNEIVSLDLSYNGSLKILDVSNNKLTFLDMLNVGYKLDKFNATGNADLRCIRVYLTYIFIPNFPTAKDVTAIYSQNCAALRVEDFNADNFIKIYPNPTKDLLHLDLQNELSGIITDLTGKTLMNVNTKDVDVSSLSAGIYLLEVTSEGKHYVSKIVKQ
jgi:Leucine-rich repeat (LRR) protein